MGTKKTRATRRPARAAPSRPLPQRARRDDRRPSHVVGIGGSAGSLEPIETFLSAVPADTSLTFIVVTHRDPRSEAAMMVDILARSTPLRVSEAVHGEVVERGAVYVVPSDKRLGMSKRRIELRDRPTDPRERTPIDSLFWAIAGDAGDRAVAVVLSGMGSDGTVGLGAIKESLGITLVQEPASAAYDAMPRSAIATGLADFVAAPRALAETLVAIGAHPHPPASAPAANATEAAEPSFDDVLDVVRARSGNDFAQYKKSTTSRRIERRMKLHRMTGIPAYLGLLERDPAEADRLLGDLLIGVTRFFRDPAAFEALAEDALGPLLQIVSPGRPLRAWVAGCATGEEAYSLAILLREQWERLGRRQPLDALVYATDLDAAAITRARRGVYGHDIGVDVSSERLARFFVKDEHGYRVRKEIREMVVFATQNVVSDPPFTRLDVLCCRNVLIYLQPELQRRIMPLFMYALAPGGVLMLGLAEAVHGFDDGFTLLRSELKIWRRTASGRGTKDLTEMPRSVPLRAPARRARPAPPPRAPRATLPEIVQRSVVEHVAPPVIVVDKAGDLQLASQRMSRYFELPAGKATVNVFAMAREGLALPLRALVRRALARQTRASERGVHYRNVREERAVDLVAWPLDGDGFEHHVLIAFEDVARLPDLKPSKGTKHRRAGAQAAVELRRAKTQLATVMDEMARSEEALHIANDELQAANEELQSTNEELQSTNEELTTSKEEMQSMNEELLSLNAELQSSNEQYTTANDDMRNLLDSSQIPTLFLDNELRLKRFTAQAPRIARLIATDVGRPITDLTWNIRYSTIALDVEAVLATLVFKEVEVTALDGAVYTMRIHPYRTVDELIDGVVVTFVDVTRQKQVAAVLAAEQQLAVLDAAVRRWPGIAYVEEVSSGRTLVVSRVTAKVLGYDPEVLTRATEAFWRALRPGRSGHPARRGLTELRRQDGVLLPYRETATAVAHAPDGAPRLVLHTFKKRKKGGN